MDCLIWRDAFLYQYDLRAWSTNHALYSKMECISNMGIYKHIDISFSQKHRIFTCKMFDTICFSFALLISQKSLMQHATTNLILLFLKILFWITSFLEVGGTCSSGTLNCKRFYRIDPTARFVLCGQTFSIQCQVAPAIVIFFMPQSQLFLLSTRIHFTLKVQDHERGLKINGSTVNDGRMWIRKHQFE